MSWRKAFCGLLELYTAYGLDWIGLYGLVASGFESGLYGTGWPEGSSSPNSSLRALKGVAGTLADTLADLKGLLGVPVEFWGKMKGLLEEYFVGDLKGLFGVVGTEVPGAVGSVAEFSGKKKNTFKVFNLLLLLQGIRELMCVWERKRSARKRKIDR